HVAARVSGPHDAVVESDEPANRAVAAGRDGAGRARILDLAAVLTDQPADHPVRHGRHAAAPGREGELDRTKVVADQPACDPVRADLHVAARVSGPHDAVADADEPAGRAVAAGRDVAGCERMLDLAAVLADEAAGDPVRPDLHVAA